MKNYVYYEIIYHLRIEYVKQKNEVVKPLVDKKMNKV